MLGYERPKIRASRKSEAGKNSYTMPENEHLEKVEKRIRKHARIGFDHSRDSNLNLQASEAKGLTWPYRIDYGAC